MAASKRTKATIKTRQRQHAVQRAQQRYGITVTARQIREMVKRIQIGKSRAVRAVSNTRTLHEVENGGQMFLALYDKTRQNICTFYPFAHHGETPADADEGDSGPARGNLDEEGDGE